MTDREISMRCHYIQKCVLQYCNPRKLDSKYQMVNLESQKCLVFKNANGADALDEAVRHLSGCSKEYLLIPHSRYNVIHLTFNKLASFICLGAVRNTC